MPLFQNLMREDYDNFNKWFGQLGGWAQGMEARLPELSARFPDPADFARAVVMAGLQGTNAYQYMTPGYEDFLIKHAPEAYALQNMMAIGREGTLPGNDFPTFWKNWMSPSYLGNPTQVATGTGGNYGFGGLTSGAMNDLWNQFVNTYNRFQGGEDRLQWMKKLMPQDLQSMHELALKSTMSPFGQQVYGKYMDEAYTLWSAYTKAMPWVNFLRNLTGGTGPS